MTLEEKGAETPPPSSPYDEQMMCASSLQTKCWIFSDCIRITTTDFEILVQSTFANTFTLRKCIKILSEWIYEAVTKETLP